ncbi:MAG: type II toxin-antitoxin system Phd/YefM family antitoxin [Gammaproteobacteria bacterium]|nr:type II toxin-antitoxin system Phd/YefM family antitoxin [Gammaproteobacteria bacterium]NND38701.1 type II toxin-antitoxin system Phd/YefM family antitoxin [Pseudomonadales bacterium]RZV50464.1 MAG: type II toxin-antitoxin system Phd/YefM family antitoxin [Pseudomonadales bacterium]
MSLATHIKPISFLKANAASVAAELKAGGEPYIITQNGEAAMVVQSVEAYEQSQNTMAMLEMLRQSESDINNGRHESMEETFTRLRKRLVE